MDRQPKSPFEIASRIAVLRSIHVETPRDSEFRRHLDRLLKCNAQGDSLPEPVRFTANGETRGIIVIAEAGDGKTTLVEHAMHTHPALQPSNEGAPPRYLNVGVPSPATLKSLGLEVLRASGYPEVSKRREGWSIWQLVRRRLQLLGTVVLWIDEAHDLFHSASSREIEDMLKTLKSLMQGDDAVIVVLTGVETLWQIAGFDQQVQRRYSKIRLAAVSEAADGDDLRALVDGFCAKAQIEPPREADLIRRLVHASRRRFGRCIENTINAIEIALNAGDARLDIQHFAEAWAMQEGCDAEQNVFLARNWHEIELDAPVRPAPTRAGRGRMVS